MALIGLLLFGIVGVVALAVGLAIVGALFHAVVWLVLLPFRLIGAMVAGAAAMFAIGIVAIVGVALAVALGIALLAPFLPLVIVGGLIWLVVRALRRPVVV